MMLQATELGLGSVWVCYFNPDILCREFELPEHLEPINILAIGYSNAGTADTSRFDRQRIALSQLVTYENNSISFNKSPYCLADIFKAIGRFRILPPLPSQYHNTGFLRTGWPRAPFRRIPPLHSWSVPAMCKSGTENF